MEKEKLTVKQILNQGSNVKLIYGKQFAKLYDSYDYHERILIPFSSQEEQTISHLIDIGCSKIKIVYTGAGCRGIIVEWIFGK
jgi:hypothetical protein